MSDAAGSPAASAPAPGTGLESALRWGFEQAIARDARRIVCVDPDWAGWPWADADLLAQLAVGLKRPGRRLVLLAGHYDEVPRRFPRFVAWRRPWVHAIDAFAPFADTGADLPTLLVDDGGVRVRLLDRMNGRVEVGIDAAAAAAWRERVDALLQRCGPAFSATQLGL